MPLENRSIGTQGLEASSIGYGAMRLSAYGTPTSEDESMN